MDLLAKDALQISRSTLPNILDVDPSQVLNILQSKSTLTDATRQSLQMPTNTSYQNNTALIIWLQKQPYDVYLAFKDALKETKQLGCLTKLEYCEREAYLKRDVPLCSNNETRQKRNSMFERMAWFSERFKVLIPEQPPKSAPMPGKTPKEMKKLREEAQEVLE